MNWLRGLIIALLVTLSACGFHLRGNIELAQGLEPLLIGGQDARSPLSISLRNALSSSGVELTTDATTARYQVVVVTQPSSSRPLSLAERSYAAEYLLEESADFTLKNDKGETVLGPQRVSERRVLRNDPNQIASKAEEEKMIRQEMLQSLALKISRQLQAYTPQPPAAEE